MNLPRSRTVSAPDLVPLWVYGAIALSFFAIHGGRQLWNSRPENLLWACHLACAVIGLGLLLRSKEINAIGVLLLTVGVPTWLVNLFFDGEFFATSVLTHVGGLTLGVIGLRRLGLPARAWRHALASAALLILICRLATPVGRNVNLAFDAWGPLRAYCPTQTAHICLLLAQWGLLLAVAELIARS